MIKIFAGEDRVRAKEEIIRVLGDNYEVIEGSELTIADLSSVFLGTTFFNDKRKILIQDLSVNKAVFELLPNYLDTPHDIVLLELKLDKRSVTYKALKDKIEIKDFALSKDRSFNVVFDIYKIAKRDGKKAVEQLEQIKPNQDPMMFFGLMASQALKEYAAKQGIREKKILRELSRLDLQMKSSPTDAWLLIDSFLLRLSSI